jgi:6-phosphogluconolactonase (cycloisomerase 2 family)
MFLRRRYQARRANAAIASNDPNREDTIVKANHTLVHLAILLLCSSGVSTAFAAGKFLYLQSNNVADGANSVIAYMRKSDGTLSPHPSGPFLTRGTGINNSTNGKLGPNDNDSPIVVSADKKRLFAVNGHSNTIAVFNIQSTGALEHVPGSPFDSMGINPVSLAISGEILLVANRNEDPHQLKALKGGADSSYVSFQIGEDGSLSFRSKSELKDGYKPSQVLVSSRNSQIAFGNDFQVDADFDGDGDVSRLFGNEPQVRGRVHTFKISRNPGHIQPVDQQALPETVMPAPGVPSVPLGLWDHPEKNLLYVGLVTRNQLGVYRYDDDGKLTFLTSVPNSGQDICWLKTNVDGTRLYAVNNLPREEHRDRGSSITVFDISGSNAEHPIEIGRTVLPLPLGTFVNNRNSEQPNSTAFQFDIDDSETFLYVVNQRVNQTSGNQTTNGNVLHTLKIHPSGRLSMVESRHLTQDGVTYNSRPQGVVSVDL